MISTTAAFSGFLLRPWRIIVGDVTCVQECAGSCRRVAL